MEHADQLHIRDGSRGAVITVKVVPAASRDKLVGVLGDALKVTTAAPAEKGKANAAVARLLAEALGCGRRDVRLVSSPSNPRKEFQIAGTTAADLRRRLEAL